MKIKDNVSVSLVEGGYRFIITPLLDDNGQVPKWAKPKKIMSRNVPELLGLNKYNSIGKAVLDRMCALQKEFIDPYYTVRGAVGEYMVLEELLHRYAKQGIVAELKGFDTATENYDMFKDNSKFGGVVDILATKPSKVVIEVKSKDNKKWVEIADMGNYPIEEVMQGKTLSYLMKTPKIIMAYVFTTDNCEKKLKTYVERKKHLIWQKDENGNLLRNEKTGKALPPKNKSGKEIVEELGLTIRDFRFKYQSYTIDFAEFEKELEKAHENYMQLSNNQSNEFVIPKDKFNKYEIIDIENFIKGEK